MTSVFFAFLYILIFFKMIFEDLCIIFEKKKTLVAIAVVVGEIALAKVGRFVPRCSVERRAFFLNHKKKRLFILGMNVFFF